VEPVATDETRTTGKLADNCRQVEARHFSLICEELNRLAVIMVAAHPHRDLSAGDLVSELYHRLTGKRARSAEPVTLQFLAAAAPLVRQALVQIARQRPPVFSGPQAEFLEKLDGSLTLLAQADSNLAMLVELRFFAGMTTEEAAPSAAIPSAQVTMLWDLGRAWLKANISG
jgi:ECF sigma factor